jgi:rfaE bifunctional protein nucleotidyltransferase chain/domain
LKAARARDKIESIDRLLPKLARARRAGDSIVFTNGCFDLFHRGHVRSLEAASRLGDRLVVAINLDASVRRAKGSDRPILPARARMELVAALACVDWVVGFAADTPLRLIERIRPEVLAKGGDWALDEIVGRDVVENRGGRVVALRVHPGPRTRDLIEQIRKNDPRSRR